MPQLKRETEINPRTPFIFNVCILLLTIVCVYPIQSATGTDVTHRDQILPLQNSNFEYSGSSQSSSEHSPQRIAAVEKNNRDFKFQDPFEQKKTKQASDIPDPIEPWNRGMFWFNDKAYFYVIKPTTKGYRSLVGPDARRVVSNFFNNLDEARNFANSLLQARPRDAGQSLSRLVINSTAGIGGLFNPAGYLFEESDRTLDQTFGKWGIPPGFYIVWPLYGSSTLRGTVGEVGDGYLYPPYYLDGDDADIAIYGLSGLRNINKTSFELGRYEELKRASVDPYTALKNVYEQRLQKKLSQ